MSKSIGKMLTALVVLLAAGSAHATMITVDAMANSSSGGTGASTGISLAAGQSFSVTVDPDDLWNAGALPRWSNADGLVGDLFATGSDESGESAGTKIGQDFGLWTQFGLSAPFGSLVGELTGTYFLIGTSFSAPAPAAGPLNLYYWDSNNGDNTESVVAEISTVDVPVPATTVLIALGMLALGLVYRRHPVI